MQDEVFDHRLSTLYRSDAVSAIPEGTSVLSEIQRRLAHRRARRRHPLILASSLAVIVLAVLVAATPARAAIGHALLPFGFAQRFGTVLIGPTALPQRNQPVLDSRTQSKSVPSVQNLGTPSLTLAEAQQQAAFPIPTPAWLPPGVVFRGALVVPESRTVVLSYRGTEGPLKGMGIQIKQGAPAGGYAIPASAARTVTVLGQAAVYTPGVWDESGNWNGTADAGLLSWQRGGFTYVLSFSGLGLTTADVVRIAESLQ
jgi:hypothetical protein